MDEFMSSVPRDGMLARSSSHTWRQRRCRSPGSVTAGVLVGAGCVGAACAGADAAGAWPAGTAAGRGATCAGAGVTGRDGEVRAKPFNPYVKALIDSCITAMGIDRSRIYLLGASMGAQGVWKMLEDNPDTFAAAFCASGSGRDLSIKNLEKTPVYITRGSEERDRRGEGISELVAKINENGGEAKFELLEGMNHPQATREAFTEERLQWVFSHVRGTEK
jgi:dienelactone hydrolase